jgi:hypothetical protein
MVFGDSSTETFRQRVWLLHFLLYVVLAYGVYRHF